MKKMLISLLIVLIIMLVMIILPFYLKDKIGEYDISNYNVLLDKLKNKSDVHSKLLIFPTINDNITDFKYEEQDGLFDGSYYLYIVATYNIEGYNKEIDRISNISFNDRKIIKNNNMYVSIYDRMGTYEYVILDENNNKIIYIFNQLFDFKETDIKEEYILNYIKGNLKYGYNMYYEGE